ncbi:MAG: extracellular solute-binding protein [Acetatifactor sp.]|nr:extracellular solute-binding protein [Acetatifactor sp.]
MWKRMKKILALGMTAAVLLAGCGPSAGTGGDSPAGLFGAAENAGVQSNSGGNTENNQKAMGRYMESDIVLPEEIEFGLDMRLTDSGVELTAWDGALYRSLDQGQNWQMVNRAPEKLQERLTEGTTSYFMQNQTGDVIGGYIEFFKDEEGNTDYNSYGYFHNLYLADGSVIPLDLSDGEYIHTAVCDGEGVFYLGSSRRVYRVNGLSGSLEVLAEARCDYLTVCGKYLMIQGEELQIYDLEENKMAQQDTALNEFLEPWLGSYGDVNSRPYLLYMPQTEDGGLYVLTDKGLYHHTLYGSTMEQLIDGSLCSMSDPLKEFVGMVQLGDVFWVLYSGGQLKQYVYDPTVSAVPENYMRVWGLYEDDDIRRAVSAFGQAHPDFYITYEHPLSEDTGMTREDAMKVLSTELATGNGPDVLLLDELPYDTYVEKGVLADLTATLDGTGERYMDAVRASYERDGGQYAMPMSMAMPVLMGARDKIQGLASLEQLAELAEATRVSQPEGSLFGFSRAEDALRLLATGSMESWMDENGGVNREAIQEFLTLSRRIYDAQVSGLTAKELESMEMMQMYVNGKPITRTEAGYQLSNAMYFRQPYAMGMVDNNLSTMGGYGTVVEILKLLEMDFVPMPGQSQFQGQASKILAVNEASKVKEQALELVAYALSTKFVEDSYMYGGSTNWDALEAQAAKEQSEGYGLCMSFMDIEGNEQIIAVGTPSQEAIEALRQLMENCQGISQCDSRVFEAVIEEGQKALTGELTVEDAVKAIEKKVALYLAE